MECFFFCYKNKMNGNVTSLELNGKYLNEFDSQPLQTRKKERKNMNE